MSAQPMCTDTGGFGPVARLSETRVDQNREDSRASFKRSFCTKQHEIAGLNRENQSQPAQLE